MELTQLKYFLCTANCGQINHAAEILHVSQSAISTAISRLEAELGVDLFRKSGRNIKLTENGERLIAMITPAVAQLDFARDEMLSSGHSEPDVIHLSVEVPDFGSELTRLYYQENPNAHFSLSIDPTDVALQKLHSGTVDFTLSFEPIINPEIISEHIFHDRVLLQMSREHPLAHRESVWLSEVAEDNFISFNRDYSFRRWMEGICFLAGFRPKVRFEVCDTQGIMALLLVQNAVTFIAESSWKLLAHQSSSVGSRENPIIALPLNDSFCERRCYLCYHRNRRLSQAALDFMNYARRFYVTLEFLRNDPDTPAVLSPFPFQNCE